jgi:hypothetical protein
MIVHVLQQRRYVQATGASRDLFFFSFFQKKNTIEMLSYNIKRLVYIWHG